MRGVSRASAALTVVNAIPTGIGCAVGVSRYVTVSVDSEAAVETAIECRPAGANTPLVRASVHAGLRRASPGEFRSVQLQLSSGIPVAKGLKSSSAVATATIRAVARSAGIELKLSEVARMAADVGRSVGLSATGGYDDALAGLRPGFVVTDNRTDQLLLARPAEPEWAAVVLVPAGHHPTAPTLRAKFQAVAADGELAAQHAREGRFSEAMRANSELVERVMHYHYAPLRARAAEAGAIAAGVSGLGPAFGVIVPRAQQPAVRTVLQSTPGEILELDLTQEVAP
jgi:shikimate kinase